jgi:hypothetical protein
MEKQEEDKQVSNDVIPEIARKKITKRRRRLTTKRRRRLNPF